MSLARCASPSARSAARTRAWPAHHGSTPIRRRTARARARVMSDGGTPAGRAFLGGDRAAPVSFAGTSLRSRSAANARRRRASSRRVRGVSSLAMIIPSSVPAISWHTTTAALSAPSTRCPGWTIRDRSDEPPSPGHRRHFVPTGTPGRTAIHVPAIPNPLPVCHDVLLFFHSARPVDVSEGPLDPSGRRTGAQDGTDFCCHSDPPRPLRGRRTNRPRPRPATPWMGMRSRGWL